MLRTVGVYLSISLFQKIFNSMVTDELILYYDTTIYTFLSNILNTEFKGNASDIVNPFGT